MINTRIEDTVTILDLHGPLVSGEDSSGVAALASGHMTANNRSGQLKLCDLNQKLRDVFTVMRLDVIFDWYETEDAAIASVIKVS
jgi:anti-anti-sigma regulatory factor